MKNTHRIMASLGFVIVSLCLAVVLTSCGRTGGDASRYHCPMHPTYVSDRPGDCPICNMRLVPIEESTHSDSSPSQESHSPASQPAVQSGAAYICPMCPEVGSDVPARCPECGMDLIKSEKPPMEEESGQTATQPSGQRKVLFYRNPMDPSITSPVPAKDQMGMDYVPVYAEDAAPKMGPVEGLASIRVTPEGASLAGIQTATATLGTLARTIRTVGTVVADESRVRRVHTKISGWIETLNANFTGQEVRKGEPILTIYSPELLSSQEEFIQARDAARKFAKSSIPEVRRGGEDLIKAAKRRLELFDVPRDFISNLEKSGQPQRTVSLLAPVSGYITSKEAFEGLQVEPGMELFTVTDLSSVWVEAEVYEFEIPSVHVGQKSVLTLPHDPGVSIEGRVDYVYPYLNPESRTLKVRMNHDNPGLVLKPAMYVNVELRVGGEETVIVPESAILDTGTRQIVFIDNGGGNLSPRQVRVGMRGDGSVQILDGVSPGERVAIRANFLLDSESRLRAVLEGMSSSGAHQHGGAAQ